MSSLYFRGVTWNFPHPPQQDQGTDRIRGRCVAGLSNWEYTTLDRLRADEPKVADTRKGRRSAPRAPRRWPASPAMPTVREKEF